MLSTLMALPVVAGIAAIVVLAARISHSEGRPTAGQLCWLAVPLLTLAALAVLCLLGLYQGWPIEPLVLVVAALAASWVMLRRDRVRASAMAWVEARNRTRASAHALFTLGAFSPARCSGTWPSSSRTTTACSGWPPSTRCSSAC